MLVTHQFAVDAQALAEVLEYGASKEAVLTALGVSELAYMDPFNVRIDGGYAEFTNLRVKNWAVADNEVLVFGQLKSLLTQALDFPDLGPQALVSFTGTTIDSPALPTAPGVHRLEADSTEPTGLKWVLRPASAVDDLPTAITENLRIAIGTFSVAPQSDLAFASAGLFIAWLQQHIVFEPLLLIFSDADDHTFRWPQAEPVGDPFASDVTGYVWQQNIEPHDFGPYFRGRGRLVISSASATTGVEAQQPLRFTHLVGKNLNLALYSPVNIERFASVSPAYVLELRYSKLHLAHRLTVEQTTILPVASDIPQTSLYSTRLLRCHLTREGQGVLLLTHGSDDQLTGFHWGLLQSCTGDTRLGIYSHLSIETGAPLDDYRQHHNRFGWRLVSCRLRGDTLVHYENPPPLTTYLMSPVNFTFVNCRMYLASLILGQQVNANAHNFNFVHSFVRAQQLTVRDHRVAPSLVKLMGSSVLAASMSVVHELDQRQLNSISEVPRDQLETPGYIHLHASLFGVAFPADASSDDQLVGDASIKPSVYADLGSRFYVKGTVDTALVEFGTLGEASTLLSS